VEVDFTRLGSGELGDWRSGVDRRGEAEGDLERVSEKELG